MAKNMAKNMANQQATKTRAKNFSEAECKVLLSACDKFHGIINKNSSRDKDKKAKSVAWAKIKAGFDGYCKSEGIYVSKNQLLFCSLFF